MHISVIRLSIAPLVTAGVLALAVPGKAASISPVYTTTFQDAVTGDNAFIGTVPGNNDFKRYWDIDPVADSYQNEFYERPTVQTYVVIEEQDSGNEKFAANEYFENLDIVEGKVGFDDEFLYFAIELFGRDKSTSDGVDTPEGLIYEYGVRFSTDPDGRNGFLLRTDQPELKNGTTFGTLGNLGFRDTDGDVGGAALKSGGGLTGLSVTKEDNPNEETDLNGFDEQVIADGKKKEDPNKDAEVLFSRIDPTNDRIVEIAFAYKAFGLDADFPSLIQYLDLQAIKGDPQDPQNYLWNDKYNKSEAGSPYRATSGDLSKSEFGTQGLENIYELDTLRGGQIAPPIVEVPEPSTILGIGLALGLGALSLKRKKIEDE
ncbi:MAG: PEP-CTERM sorting domain-containing protein [Xenococcaceae cyanobacterium]